MTKLLPVVLRGILPDNVRLTIVKICAFLNAVSQKIRPGEFDKAAKRCGAMSCWLWADISTIFLQHHDTSSSAPCERDWYPRTSISTQHIPIRKVHGVLKKCVRNRARPEGSIVSAYGTEEVIDFCVDFIDDLKPIGVPESRYEGRLNGKGTLGKKSYVCTDDFSFKKAHYMVLQQ